MAVDDKVFKPQVVEDVAFPLLPDENQSVESGYSNKTYTPRQIKENKFPKKIVAQELLSSVLNTKSRKILQGMEFTQSGALQIGSFEAGISGDLRIARSGLVARNSSGITTFAIDGETGDATFAGEIQSGTLLTGSIEIAGGDTVIDQYGINSSSQFQVLTLTSSTPQSTASTSYTDVSGSSFTINAGRSFNVLFSVFAYLRTGVGEFAQNGYEASCILYDSYLSGASVGTLISGGNNSLYVVTDGAGAVTSQTQRTASQATSITTINSVAQGTHNYKLQFKTSGGTGYVDAFSVSLVILGT